jgi:hypothetical protein
MAGKHIAIQGRERNVREFRNYWKALLRVEDLAVQGETPDRKPDPPSARPERVWEPREACFLPEDRQNEWFFLPGGISCPQSGKLLRGAFGSSGLKQSWLPPVDFIQEM